MTRLYASVEDEALRFYGDPRMRARALRALHGQSYLEGRAAERLIADAQDRAERLHAGQRQQLFKLDDVVEAQRRAFLRAYDAVLAHPTPDELLRGAIAAVAAGEAASRPSDGPAASAWPAGLAARYGIAQDALPSAVKDEPDAEFPLVGTLRAALEERFDRAGMEWGANWPEVARAVLLRTATEQWAAHVEALDEVQRQAPALFSFLSAPVEISYAREANRRYAGFNWLVQAEALASLLTLPLPYERAVPARDASALPATVLALPALRGAVPPADRSETRYNRRAGTPARPSGSADAGVKEKG